MSETTPDAGASATPARRATSTWLVATIAGFVGLFYAYAVWNAIGNLIQAVSYYGEAGFSLNALGWFVWIFAAVFPAIVFAGAFALGIRRPPHHLLLVLITGLAVVAVFWLNVVAYTTLNTTSLVG